MVRSSCRRSAAGATVGQKDRRRRLKPMEGRAGQRRPIASPCGRYARRAPASAAARAADSGRRGRRGRGPRSRRSRAPAPAHAAPRCRSAPRKGSPSSATRAASARRELAVFDRRARIDVVEDDLGPTGKAGEFGERRLDGGLGQIDGDAEPHDEGWRPRVVPGGGQRRSEAAEVEVMRHIDGMRRLDDARRGEPAALLGLRRRMIELEEAQVRRRLEAIGEGVEPGAEDDDLPARRRRRRLSPRPRRSGCAWR